MGPLNQQKIHKIQAWTSQCPFLYSLMSQDRPRIVPGSPRTVKWRHQACQMTPMGTKIHKKSVKIQAWTLKCPLLCSPVSQNRPRVPKYAKVKPPIMLNDRFAYQECQGPLATMPRNCNPEAMSNDRGPAAEGVAHKIIINIIFS